MNPMNTAANHHSRSLLITAPFATLILQQEKDYPHNISKKQAAIKRTVKAEKRKSQSNEAKTLHDSPPNLQRAKDFGSENSVRLVDDIIPIIKHNFALHKGAFRDALCLRYGWQPSRLPSQCFCGMAFTVEHALSCSCGALPSIRHNEIRDLTAKLLTEVCHKMATEPTLQPL